MKGLKQAFVARGILLAKDKGMSMPPTPFRLLFVCLGNICRSPAAEAVMKQRIMAAGLAEKVVVDSAGTEGWHTGKPADARMRKHGKARGYELDSIARQVKREDFERFDLILVMDPQNLRDIRSFALHADLMSKVRLFTEFAEDRSETSVPDPYYGGEEGFEQVLDILENGCDHLVAALAEGRLKRL